MTKGNFSRGNVKGSGDQSGTRSHSICGPVMRQLRREINHTLVVAHGVYREECFSVSPNFQ
jgi:hypothetical protein